MSFYEPTEMRYWDKSKAHNGYTLFGAGGTSYLIDMEGCIVNKWSSGRSPCLLDNGNVILQASGARGEPTRFQELDWDGNVVWECSEKREGYSPHHDFQRIFRCRPIFIVIHRCR